MVHENFKRLLRRHLTYGHGATQGAGPIYNYIDINGHTPDAEVGETTRLTYIPNNSVVANLMTNVTLSGALNYSFSSTNTYKGDAYIIVIGNHINDEPDYSLGSFISDSNVLYTSSNNLTEGGDLLFVSTITNNSNQSISFDEVGLIYHSQGNATSQVWAGSRYMNLLLIKEVLSTPVVIPPASSVTITMNIFGTVTVSS